MGFVSAGCGNEVVVISATGSTGASTSTSSSGGEGGGPPSPRTIDVALHAVGAQDPDAILVLLNHEDGSLVESWKGSALPVAPTVIDGDFVTYVTADDGYQRADSYRVEAGVEHIERVFGFAPPEGCEGATMHVDVHVPEVAGGYQAEVSAAPYAYELGYDVPGNLGIDVPTCDGETADLFVRVSGPKGWTFQYASLPFVAGSTTQYTPTLSDGPRKPLAFDVFGNAGTVSGGGYGAWMDPWLGVLSEPTDHPEFKGDAPFHVEANLVDLPKGRPYAAAWAYYPPSQGDCESSATIERYGASDVTIPFDAGAIAEPIVDGATWKLAGAPGDMVVRTYQWGNASEAPYWQMSDDARVPRAAVFPTFPADAGAFAFPAAAPKLTDISHADVEDRTYAELVDGSTPSPIQTTRARWVSFDCEP